MSAPRDYANIASAIDSTQTWVEHAKRHHAQALHLDGHEELRMLSATNSALWQAECHVKELLEVIRELRQDTPYHTAFTAPTGAVLAERDRLIAGGDPEGKLDVVLAELDHRGVDRFRPPMVWRDGAWRDVPGDTPCRQCGVRYERHPYGDGLEECPGDFEVAS